MFLRKEAKQQQQNIDYYHVDNYETDAMLDLKVYFVFSPLFFKLQLKLLGTSTALHICSCFCVFLFRKNQSTF